MRTGFHSNEDIYGFVRDLIKQAREIGDSPTADALEEALRRSGLTASEQLGELRIALLGLGELDLRYPSTKIGLISQAVRAIDKALGRANRLF